MCSSSSFYRPMVAKMGQNQSYWASIESDIEAHLKKVISIEPPESVFEPMHYLTFTTPKSTAPALCVAACELVGGDRGQAMAAASAIHLMHVATYTHQHMQMTTEPGPELGQDGIIAELQAKALGPAHIEPKLKPDIKHKFGPNIELLTGDAIMPLAIELLVKAMNPARINSDKILRVIIEVTRAFGSQGVVEGQYREIEWTQSGDKNEELLVHVCKKKEGEIHACGATCGAILGDGSDEEVESLRKYGLYVGIIQGIINGIGTNYNKRREKRVNELRVLAMKELNTSFKGKKLMRQIASLVEESLS
ncbi:heterodimeric geranylgeranyl pyrophosphate synthase small subunit, chloroplastic-like [Solanum dulcamara]|uniref:heterodimeric geranylgeranyl pyrophosphate synthase small subunit, chloroplastic-like n=1 Tax=Solanum dulcamara TaxID=45834 RepID=UPI002485C81A|nr:heterodimeric geranylgeranyl pyrophosphate synthase small subunit, chloroplastic-like [Solanum dulcamara]